jgi:Heavy metal associated domain 2
VFTGARATVLADAYVAHRVPNRARLRVPSRRGDLGYFLDLAETMRACPTVKALVTNPSSGSVLFFHSGEFESVAEYAERKGAFLIREQEQAAASPIGRIIEGFHQADQSLRATTSGELDLATLSFGTLAAMGVYQLLRGQFLTPASTLLFYAANVLVLAAQHEARQAATSPQPAAESEA